MTPPLLKFRSDGRAARGRAIGESRPAAAFPHAVSGLSPMPEGERRRHSLHERSHGRAVARASTAAARRRRVEADRCLECGGAHAEAPCVTSCPAGIDVPSFVASIAAADPQRRRDDLRREHPRRHLRARLPRRGALPARLRAHPRGPPADRDRRAPALRDRVGVRQRRALRTPMPPNGKRVAVIGAGPAGLAAAGELAARGYSVTVTTSARRSAGSSATGSRRTASRTSRCRTRRGCSRTSASSSSWARASTQLG